MKTKKYYKSSANNCMEVQKEIPKGYDSAGKYIPPCIGMTRVTTSGKSRKPMNITKK